MTNVVKHWGKGDIQGFMELELIVTGAEVAGGVHVGVVGGVHVGVVPRKILRRETKLGFFEGIHGHEGRDG